MSKYLSKLKRNSKFNRHTTRGHSYAIQLENPKSVYRQCGKKSAYNSESEARKYAQKSKSLRGVRLRIYQCPFCRKYHLTSKVNSFIMRV